MAYEHAHDAYNQLPALDTLLERGTALGAYLEGVGWTHAGLVRLAQDFGYTGYNADFGPKSAAPKTVEEAWALLATELDRGPVLASVYAGLDPQRGGGHIVVVTGITDGVVSFCDPEERTAHEGLRALQLSGFLRAFKNRFIVIRPGVR